MDNKFLTQETMEYGADLEGVEGDSKGGGGV